MGVFERIKSAVAGAIPVEDDLDMGNNQRVRNLPSASQSRDAVKQNVGVEHPTYASTADVPSDISKGKVVYIDGDGLYVEDGL